MLNPSGHLKTFELDNEKKQENSGHSYYSSVQQIENGEVGMEFSPFFPERCFLSLEGSHLDVSCCSMSAGSWNFHSFASFGMKFIILPWLVFAAQIHGVDTAWVYFWNMDFSSKLGASGGLAFPIGSAK